MTLLLHDTGNIVKIDFDKPVFLSQEEFSNRNIFKKIQSNLINRYGCDDHVLSMKIAQEIGISPRISKFMGEKVFVLNPATEGADDYERKITAYADQRVGPEGVVTLEKRFEKAKTRSGRIRSDYAAPRLQTPCTSCFRLNFFIDPTNWNSTASST